MVLKFGLALSEKFEVISVAAEFRFSDLQDGVATRSGEVDLEQIT